MINVILVTVSDITLRGIQDILSQADGISLSGTAKDYVDCMRLVKEQSADVVILDIQSVRIPRADDIAGFYISVKELRHRTNVLVITDWSNKTRFEYARQLGIKGYCLMTISKADLTDALKAVARGELYIHSEYAEYVTRDSCSALDSVRSILGRRQMEILNLLLIGHTNQEISELLHISLPTVKSHVKVILRKLNARDRTHLISMILHNMIGESVRNSSSYS